MNWHSKLSGKSHFIKMVFWSKFVYGKVVMMCLCVVCVRFAWRLLNIYIYISAIAVHCSMSSSLLVLCDFCYSFVLNLPCSTYDSDPNHSDECFLFFIFGRGISEIIVTEKKSLIELVWTVIVSFLFFFNKVYNSCQQHWLFVSVVNIYDGMRICFLFLSLCPLQIWIDYNNERMTYLLQKLVNSHSSFKLLIRFDILPKNHLRIAVVLQCFTELRSADSRHMQKITGSETIRIAIRIHIFKYLNLFSSLNTIWWLRSIDYRTSIKCNFIFVSAWLCDRCHVHHFLDECACVELDDRPIFIIYQPKITNHSTTNSETAASKILASDRNKQTKHCEIAVQNRIKCTVFNTRHRYCQSVNPFHKWNEPYNHILAFDLCTINKPLHWHKRYFTPSKEILYVEFVRPIWVDFNFVFLRSFSASSF